MGTLAGERRGVALIIGVGNYPNAGVTQLRYAAHDAEALAELLVDRNICGFPAGCVQLLTDEAAQRDSIIRGLSVWLPQQTRQADIVVIYFAGHGIIQNVGKKQEGFLLPYDVDPENPLGRGIAMSDVARWIEGLEASAVVVCLDCCHAGKVLQRGMSLESSLHRDLGIQPAMFQDIVGTGRFLLASCDAGQYSVESSELRHGLFTYHILNGLRGAGDRDGDGRVGVAELFEYVSEAVVRDARQLGIQQKPWSASVGAGGVYLSAPQTGHPQFHGDRHFDQTDIRSVVDEIGQRMSATDEAELVQLLRQLGKLADTAGIPAIFRCLDHSSEQVREAAHRAVQAIGRAKTLAAIESLARTATDDAMADVLRGLAVFEARPDLVNLLDRLVDTLKGDMLVRACQLLERKRLSLGLEEISTLFRARDSQYKLQRVLGQGQFTAAYLAKDELTEMDVVVRVLLPEFVSQPEVRKHFLELCKTSIRIGHHNLVRTLEVRSFADKSVYYIVRAHVAGVTLQEVLNGGRKFEPLAIVKLLRQVVAALEPLHRQGICHGGIKPSNVFICADDYVVLGDLSMPVHGIGESLRQRLSYHYRYAAPETFIGSGIPDPAADFYALGCMAYELFCGAPPFVSDNYNELLIKHVVEAVPSPRQRRPLLESTVEQFLLNLLRKEPVKRPRSVAALLEQLRVLQEELLIAERHTIDPGVLAPVEEQQVSASLLHDASLARYQNQESLFSIGDSRPMTMSVSIDELKPGYEPGARDPHNLKQLNLPGFEILDVLGQGGMGVVYRARQVHLDRLVAIKMILGGSHLRPEARQRFAVEAKVIAQLSHPNIVQVFGFGECEGIPYLVLEYVNGGSLAQKVRDQRPNYRQTAELLESIARAVEYGHQLGIVHRDLKPANILLMGDGTPKITDFGLAKRFDDPQTALTHSGAVMGTPSYMAPELASGHAKAASASADIYSLGAILYELLTGSPPFTGGSLFDVLLRARTEPPVPPRRQDANIPRDLEAICLCCLEKEPDRRYSSAAALADDLQRFLSAEPIKATPPSTLRKLRAQVKAPSLWGRLRKWLTGREREKLPE